MPAPPRAKDPVRRHLRGLRRRVCPTELIKPYSALSAPSPKLKPQGISSSKLSDPRCVAFLREWTQNGVHVQKPIAAKIKVVRHPHQPDSSTSAGLDDWDISRDAPTSA